MENKIKKKKHIICNFLLILSLISVIGNFVVVLLLKNNKDLLINTLSSILLCIFVIFFILSSITNTKKNKSPIVVSSIILILFNLIQIGTNLDLLSILEINNVPDFTNKSLIDVIKWSEKNKVKINQIYEYSDTIDEYKIINQDIKEDTLTKDIKELTVSISEGANPNKEVVIPDMETWDADRVLKFINTNFLNNVNVEFVISDKNKDTVIEQSTSGTIKRSDELKLTFSLGEEESLEEVKLIDLTNKKVFDAEFYLKRNAIKYDIERDFSNKITRNNVISTNKKVGTKIKPNSDDDKLVLKVSKGKKIKVPDLKNYSMLEITEWVIKNKLKLEFTNKYDDSVKVNKVIEANYNKDDEIEEKTLIKVTISKGKLVMLSFNSLEEFKNWANKYNINYEEKYEFNNDIEEGKVISYSHKTGDTIKNDDTIVVTISQGKKTKVPNIIGDTKSEAIKKVENAKLNYNIVYENSNEEKNKVIKQSLASGSEVAENSTITITLSNGKKPTTNSNQSKSSSSKNNNKTQSGATPSTPNNQPEKTCNECNISSTKSIYRTYNGYDAIASNLKSHIESQCPGITVIISGDASSGKVAGQYVSGFISGPANSCDTIQITLAK